MLEVNNYGLHTEPILGENSTPNKMISETEYKKISKGYDYILVRLRHEEKYDLVVENYKEFLQTLNDLKPLPLDLVNPKKPVFIYQRVHLEINRRVINLLATSRLYFEYFYGTSEERTKADLKEDIEKIKGIFIKDNPGSDSVDKFNFVCELRHTSQHYDCPNQTWNIKLGSNPKDNRVKIGVTKNFLLGHKRFDQAILEKMPEQIWIDEYLAGFIEIFSYIHFKLRDEKNKVSLEFKSLLNQTFNSFNPGVTQAGVFLFKENNHCWVFDRYLSKDILNYLSLLESKNLTD